MGCLKNNECLSVCVITLNEEKNIGGCLESVKWVDEIIVIDSFSSDKTAEIARRYTDKVFQEKWEGFSRTKNRCVEKASGDWVLVVDADERVTSALAEEIRTLAAGANGYFIARKNFFLGRCIKHCGWYPDYSLRLFRRGKGSFGEREVHEAVSVDGEKATLNNSLLHYTYDSILEFVARLNRYSTLAADEMYKKVKAGSRKPLSGAGLLFRPFFTFIKMYLIKRGFLDGYYGFIISFYYSYYVFMKYAKLWEKEYQNGPCRPKD